MAFLFELVAMAIILGLALRGPSVRE
jgi:hypothetical protein